MDNLENEAVGLALKDTDYQITQNKAIEQSLKDSDNDITVSCAESPKFSFENPFLALNYQSHFDKKAISVHTKGCKWAPDGSCLLVASDDRSLSIFNLPPNVSFGEFNDENWITEGWKKDVNPVITVTENEDFYDYCWYPMMKSYEPNTCCFAVTCRDLPVHLWDAWSGQFICSYSPYDHLDQMVSAYSLSISETGAHLVCGYNKCIRVFDVNRPGRQCETIKCVEQSGIISCMSFNPELPHTYAAGSYEGSVGLYSLKYQRAFTILKGHALGVTHLQFSSDGTKLFSGTRKDDEILCWDMRNPGMILAVLKRKRTTNQRMYFDLTPDGNKFLLSGTTDGDVLIWDLDQCLPSTGSDDPSDIIPSTSFSAHNDCVNGISVHPFCPVLATSSGQRHISSPVKNDSSDSDNEKETTQVENNVKLWWLGGPIR